MPRNELHALFRQSRDMDRAADREHKRTAVYGVFQHSSGIEGGYVSREGWKTDTGHSFPSPYSAQIPIKVFRRKADAERHADILTFG